MKELERIQKERELLKQGGWEKTHEPWKERVSQEEMHDTCITWLLQIPNFRYVELYPRYRIGIPNAGKYKSSQPPEYKTLGESEHCNNLKKHNTLELDTYRRMMKRKKLNENKNINVVALN